MTRAQDIQTYSHSWLSHRFGGRACLGILIGLLSFAVCVYSVKAQSEELNEDDGELESEILRSSDTSLNSDFIDLFHAGDEIEIDLIGSIDYDWRGNVSPEGYISGMPFPSKPLNVFCKSEIAVAKEVHGILNVFLRDPNVVVRLRDRPRRAEAVIIGAVKRPTRFRLRRFARLNEIIIRGGGLTDQVSGNIKIFRQNYLSCKAFDDAKKLTDPLGIRDSVVGTIDASVSSLSRTSILDVRIEDLLKGKEQANPQILYGDVIRIEKAEPIYIIGDVRNPTRIPYHSNMTVSRAITSAGGSLEGESIKQVFILRKKMGMRVKIEVNRASILNESEELELKPNDVIEVLGNKNVRKAAPEFPIEEDSADIAQLPLEIID